MLAFDFRSSRAAARVPTTLGYHELADARAALAWLRAQPGMRTAPIGLLGESLGGSIALLAAAERADIEALVVDCAFATGVQALEDACERWAHVPRWPSAWVVRTVGGAVTGHDPGALDAVAAAAALHDRPVLFIHSLKDDRLSASHPYALWQAAGGKDPLWIIADAGHNQGWVRHRALYEARVRAFFDRHLLGRGAGLPPGKL